MLSWITSKGCLGSDILGLCVEHRSAFSLTLCIYTDHKAPKHNYIIVTVHTLAYSTYAHETLLHNHAALAFWVVLLCPVLFMSLLPSYSGCAFCHPAERVTDPKTPPCSSSIWEKKKQQTQNHILNWTSCFNLTWPSWQLQIINFCAGSLQSQKEETWQFCPNLMEKLQASPFLSVASI